MSEVKFYMSVFTNDKKVDGSNQPDYNGLATLPKDVIDELAKAPGDVELEMAGWWKESKKGFNYVSFSVKPKTKRANSGEADPY